MDHQNAFSVEKGKDEFTEMIRVRAAFNEKQKHIADAIQKAGLEIKKADGLISQTVNELAASFFMRKSKKEKKYSYIEKLKGDKNAGQKQIEELEEELRKLKLEFFGSEEVPKLCFGKYPKAPGQELQPLEWDVMRITGERALMLCTDVIEQMRYSEKLENTPWKESIIRRWANAVFYMNAFSDDERGMIPESEIANPGNNAYKTAASTNTRDYIFIPSVNDAYRFYNYDSERKACATEYAAKKGVYVDEASKGSYWWLRSNGGNMYNASAVNFEGYVFEYGFYVNSTYIGVRPALWIRLK